MDLASLTAAPVAITAGGRTFKVAPLSFFHLGMIQRYIDDRTRSPYEAARAESDRLEVPPAERDAWLAEARLASRGWKPPRVGIDPGWLEAALGSVEGSLYFLYVALERHQPTIGMDEVERFAAGLSPAQFAEVVRVALDAEPGGDDGPKAGAPGTSSPTPPGTSSGPTASSPTPSPG